jgi:hypothetical protein
MGSVGNADSCADDSVIHAARDRPGDQPQWTELCSAAPFGWLFRFMGL